MTDPSYLMLEKKDIPVVIENGTVVRIIAGEYHSVKSIVQKPVPLSYIHVTLPSGQIFSFPVESTRNAILYVFKGAELQNIIDKKVIGLNYYGIFNKGEGTNKIEVQNIGTTASDFLFLEGQPYNEPFAHQGPFVMNTRDELAKAFKDYANGEFGYIDFEG